MNDPIKLVPTKSDSELASELREELAEAAKPYLNAVTKAHSLGFHVSSSFGIDPFNRCVIVNLQLMKFF